MKLEGAQRDIKHCSKHKKGRNESQQTELKNIL